MENKISSPLALIGIAGTTVLLFVSLLSKYFLGGFLNYDYIFFISRLLIWVIVLLTYIYSLKIEKQPFIISNGKEYPFINGIIHVVLLLIAIYIGSIIIGISLKLFNLKEHSKVIDKIVIIFKNNWSFLFFASITAGITEELLFRGYILTRLKIILNSSTWAIIISSLLFALLHISYGTIREIIGVMFIGVLFASYFLKYKNLYVLILTHFLFDTIQFLLLIRFYKH